MWRERSVYTLRRGRIMPAMSHSSGNLPPAEALRALPAVDHLLRQPPVEKLLDDYPRSEVVLAVRAVLDERRAALRAGLSAAVDTPTLALAIRQQLYERSRPHLRKVINATGIVLHTGLGRAPLPTAAIEAITETAAGYCNLEFNLETGRRGNRHDHLREVLREVCGVEDALVVNNNAAATFLALNTFAANREAVVSRGQLVEIGGSYRLPDIMAAARCRLVEVGTTNRTRISDYERALNENTGILLRVHTSNYRVMGFTESTPLEQLVELARRNNVLVVDDLGSGLLTHDLPWPQGSAGENDESPAHLAGPRGWDEPSIQASVAGGADVTLFSGDKLLGGPQAGILVGQRELIAALRKNPLARAFRPGKLTLAALEATVRLYRDLDSVVQRVPGLRLLSRTQVELESVAHQLAQEIADALPDADVRGVADYSEAGGGSLPTQPLPTWVVAVRLPGIDAEAIATELRRQEVPVICRLRDEALVFDPRTLASEEVAQVAPALVEAVREIGSNSA